MEEINIPLYRAKRIDSEDYVIGSYIAGLYAIIPNELQAKVINGKIDIDLSEILKMRVIDITTLAIHFPKMLDSENNKIFASLREDGKGGDLCEIDNGARFGVFIWHKYAMCIDLKCTKVVDWKSEFKELKPQEYKTRTKVIGIQK